MTQMAKRLVVVVAIALAGWLAPAGAGATINRMVPVIETFDLSSGDLYPVVRDDFKDEVEFTWYSNDTSPGQVDVISPSGVVVASFFDRYGSGSGTWDGTDQSGNVVAVGTYTFRLTVTNSEDGSSATSARLLEVKSDIVSKKIKVHVLGHKATRRTHSPGCSVGRFGIAADLDCNGGRFAQVQFAFKVPRDARGFKVRYDDFPGGYSPGRYIRQAERVRPTRFVVTVRVTGYRSVILDAVDLLYTAKVRR
ncbi:hypothetical protein EXE59_09835 [Nocardioides eburneiflavus]|uniref:FlgD Ig-like domain-containing protein n=1 Tax=Nocardioides eburneiflavus TaxID=2518372 RepID=A0A4Z1CMC8_9ACTN|nr:hypothetical protein [Nocardioides eburneiflavus]TGN64219.1 hypothetical protein EXE59_09835 [Nocardioides eburneiflavus]